MAFATKSKSLVQSARRSNRAGFVLLGLVSSVILDSVRAQGPQFVSEHRMWPFAGARLTGHLDGAVAFGDLDGDGDLDALRVGEGIEVYFNEGQARFVRASPSTSSSSIGEYSSVSLGDIDGDGDLDAVIGNGRNLHCWTSYDGILTNDGTGHFVGGGSLPPVLDCTHDVEFVDLNGDNLVDLVFASYDIDPCRVLQNQGAGVFTNVTIPVVNTCYDVVSADLEGDGDQDLLFVSFGSSRWLVNNGSFQFQLDPMVLPGGRCAAVGDVDGDGDSDIVIGSANNVTLLLRTALQQFPVAVGAFPLVSGTVHTVALGDIDGDQDLDVLTGMEFAPGILFTNSGSGSFTPAPASMFTPVSPSGISQLVDIEADGDLDAVVERGLLLNDGSGRLVNVAGTSPQTSVWASAAVTADFDGDGELDIATAKRNFGGVEIYMGEGAGVFRDASQPDPSAYPVLSLGAGDLDDDGDVDILVGMEYPTNPNYVMWNNGSAQFTISTAAEFGNQAADIEIADLDGDGDLDVFLAAQTNPPEATRLLINLGNGTFANSPNFLPPIPVNGFRDFALGDLDGDGDLDVWGGRGSQDAVWLNDGTAHFIALAGATPTFLDGTYRIALGDFDRDGDVDSICYVYPSILRLYLNDGSAHFTVATFALPTVDTNSNLASADFDNDGDLDLCVANHGAPRQFLRNDGTAHFTAEELEGVPRWFSNSRLIVADFDRDRDLDVFDAGSGVWKNTLRDVSWRSTPRIGYPLTIDVHGSPNAAFRLAASTAEMNTPLPPLGLLRIDTQAVRFATIGVLDASGVGSVVLAIPNDPVLIGRTYYWQALVGTPMRLTGLEKTTFTGL